MSIEERLSKLNAKTQSFTDSAGGFGGMSVSDLAGAMAGVSKIGELVIRRKYIDPLDKGEGYYELMRESILRVCKKDAQPKKTNMIQPLLDIALDDYCGNNLCKSCGGRGEVLSAGVMRKCRSNTCVEGRTAMKDYQKAVRLGVNSMDYRRNYREAYRVIEDYLTRTLPNAEGEAIGLIKKQSKWHDVG